MSSGAECKKLGNDALTQGRYQKAIDHYSIGISFEDDNHVLYSNRSAAYCKANRYSEALVDALKTVKIKPDWPKAYSRLGTAYQYLGKIDEAKSAFEKGLEIDGKNASLKTQLDQLNSSDAMDVDSTTTTKPPKEQSKFNDDKLWATLKKNPLVVGMLEDEEVKEMIKLAKEDEEVANEKYGENEKFIRLQLLMNGFGSDLLNQDLFPPPRKTSNTTKNPSEDAKKKMEEEKRLAALSPIERKAEIEKQKGNVCYKTRDFEGAKSHYEKAAELCPENIVYTLNKTAVLYEEKKYEECIELGKKCIEVGRDNRTDYAIIAKAMTRIGTCYEKLQDLEEALKWYNKSATENRTKDTVKKMKQLESIVGARKKLEYINPELAKQENEKGISELKSGHFPNALKCFEEALRRNPNDANIPLNKGTAYMKLMEFPMAVKEFDNAIKLDNNLLDAYIKKGDALFAMKQTSQARSAYDRAAEIDPTSQEARNRIYKCINENYKQTPEEIAKQAMNDPEVANIMKDPSMRLILENMKNNPQASQEYMRNPEVMVKIQKLMDAGIIQIR
ncbi:hypothetical protein SNEBB_004983 [Seison nebaliae]|nr:hypothetical protein SNEBB_004983 [Seison nebaliae]